MGTPKTHNPIYCIRENLENGLNLKKRHYCDVLIGAVASQITSLTVVYSAVYSSTDQRKHQSSASLAFVRGIHRGPVNFPQKRASKAENDSI